MLSRSYPWPKLWILTLEVKLNTLTPERLAKQSWAQLLEVATEGTPAELAQLLGLLNHYPNAEMRTAIRRIAFERWFRLDAKAAWRFAREESKRSGQDDWIDAAMRAWADLDPYEAAETVSASDFPSEWRPLAGDVVLGQISDRDPRLAADILRKHGFGSFRVLRDLFGRFALIAPEEAAEFALSWSGGVEFSRYFALDMAISQWALADHKAAFEWTQANAPNRHDALNNVARAWGFKDPEGLFASEELLTLKRYPEIIGRVLGVWWASDSAAARDWFEQQDLVQDPKQKTLLVNQLLQTLSFRDPAAAATLVTKVERAASDWGAIARVGERWAREEPDNALRWAKGLAKGDARDNALLRACAQIAKRDPLRMLDELPALATGLHSEFAQQRVLARTMIDALSHQGLAETHKWLDQLPAAFRRTFWEGYADAWGAREPQAVIDHLLSQETEQNQLMGVQTALSAWARTDPNAAAERLLTFPDSEMRALAARNVMNVWRLADPDAAQAWLDSVSDPVVKKALLVLPMPMSPE